MEEEKQPESFTLSSSGDHQVLISPPCPFLPRDPPPHTRTPGLSSLIRPSCPAVFAVTEGEEERLGYLALKSNK